MKILHVVHQFPSPPSGGTERVVFALARSMADAGHDVTIVAGTIEGGTARELREGLVEDLRVVKIPREDLFFESWEKAWSPSVGERFAALLRAQRPDVVHVHHWLRLTTDLVRIARREGVAVVACTLHDYWTQLATPTRPVGLDRPEPPAGPRWSNEAERREAFAAHRADLVDELRAADLRFAPSAAHARGIEAFAGVPLGAIETTPPPLLDVPERRAAPSGPRGRTLLFWGSIYREKGLDVVLDALASVGGWRLVVLGEVHDPAYRERLAARCAHLPVEFRGRFTPADLARVSADYAVVPATSHESYGLVIDEARCVGLPLIASDLPSFREHADPSASLFFTPDDPGSLAMLLLDDARLLAMREPMPHAVRASESAAQLLARYADVRAQVRPPLAHAPRFTGAMRAALLFRRAERRLWSALQNGGPVVPPEGFLGD
ncbi:MAG: glycosyltransferase [Planctomycetes bacterium]|nr:glycosyltransferase [Planctomycetota bacterium]